MLHSDWGCGSEESECNSLTLCCSSFVLRPTLYQTLGGERLGIQSAYKNLVPSFTESTL